MLEIIVICIILIGFLLLGNYAFNKSEKIREQMMEEFETDEDGNLEVYTSESNLSRPTLPFPTIDELGIRNGSQLEKVYYHITRNGYLKPSDYKFIGITRSAGYIYRLRKMGFTIATETDKDGKFKQYKLICYKIK